MLLKVRDHNLIVKGSIMEVKLGVTKIPTIQEWREAGLDIDSSDENIKVCFRRGRSGIYEYIHKGFYFRISMTGKPEGKAPLEVGLKLMKLWLNDNASTGLIAQSRRVCK